MVLRSLIRGLAQQGKMILYSSHVLEVVEKVCSKVLILRKGEVVAYDSIDHLRDLMSQPSLEGVFAQLAETEDSDAVADKILRAMRTAGDSAPERAAVAPETRIAGAAPPDFPGGAERLGTALPLLERIFRAPAGGLAE